MLLSDSNETGAQPGAMSTVFVLDDHPIVQRGLSQLFSEEKDLQICGAAGTVSEAIAQIDQLQPDLAIIDIALSDGNGLDVIRHIQAQGLPTRAVCYTRHDEAVYADRALAAGARGYVNKQEPVESVLTALRHVRQGEVYVTRTRSAGRRPQTGGSSYDAVLSLSDRELEVFELLGSGLTTREIAERLKLSHKTVESFREKIKAKLHLDNSNQLIRHAVQWVLEQA